MRKGNPAVWAFVITSTAGFMAALDNLVVTTALPSIRTHLGGGITDLEWTVNAYTLTFAVLLMLGAALGDRFGRRRLFTIGLSLFTLSSLAAALAPGIGELIAARAAQGVGAALLTPVSLTLLTSAVAPAKRGLAFGAWGAVNGMAVAMGPLIGGTVVEHLSWQWIFALNVPIGLALLPLARLRLTESHGPNSRLDIPGTALASAGLFGIVFALIVAAHVDYSSQIPPLVLSGVGMALFFAPVTTVLMGSVKPEEQGVASGANNAFREIGGALGVAVLTSVFTASGDFSSAQRYADGLTPALWVGAAAIAAATVSALIVPRWRRNATPAADAAQSAPALTPVA